MDIFAIFSLLEQSPTVFMLTTFIVSLLVGSFLNVVIYRLPVMMEREWQAQIDETNALNAGKEYTPNPTETFNLVKPDSTCPNCQHKIRAWENIPVISWIALGRKCSQCKCIEISH